MFGGGNILFYPHEEIIRFINKYVRKKNGIDSYTNILPVNEDRSFNCLDLGCGIGRHVKYLHEMGLNPYGVDLSDSAISMGKEWLATIDESLSSRLQVASVTELPFPDEYFDVCISHGVLDSMSREFANKGFKEAMRTMKPGGYMYFDLIMDDNRGNVDEIVPSGYEEGTVQSYFTKEAIYELIADVAEIVEYKVITWANERDEEYHKRAHIIVKKW